jgi:hypothetical protein
MAPCAAVVVTRSLTHHWPWSAQQSAHTARGAPQAALGMQHTHDAHTTPRPARTTIDARATRPTTCGASGSCCCARACRPRR